MVNRKSVELPVGGSNVLISIVLSEETAIMPKWHLDSIMFKKNVMFMLVRTKELSVIF